MRSKRAFTLFEILIVMTLIATALGVLTLQISKALRGGRFEQGVEQVISRLTLAQELMLDFQADVLVTLHQKSAEIIECKIEISRPLPEHLEKSISRYCKITGIEEIAFNEKAEEKIRLPFDGTLGIAPEGVITFLAHGREQKIFLNGCPAQIKRGNHEKIHIPQADYPEEIFSAS